MGVKAVSIDAIILSHHHSDHSKSAARASKNGRQIVHLETTMRLGLEPISQVRTFEGLERLYISEDLSRFQYQFLTMMQTMLQLLRVTVTEGERLLLLI